MDTTAPIGGTEVATGVKDSNSDIRTQLTTSREGITSSRELLKSSNDDDDDEAEDPVRLGEYSVALPPFA